MSLSAVNATRLQYVYTCSLCLLLVHGAKLTSVVICQLFFIYTANTKRAAREEVRAMSV